jgi:hypothetical protein
MRNSYSYHRLYDMKKENQNMELISIILNSMSKEISDASTSKN